MLVIALKERVLFIGTQFSILYAPVAWEREVLGRNCKRLLDYGRVVWLREQGLQASWCTFSNRMCLWSLWRGSRRNLGVVMNSNRGSSRALGLSGCTSRVSRPHYSSV
jgi:hypothetical protein